LTRTSIRNRRELALFAPAPLAMTARFFIDSPIRADRVVIEGTEAHHLQHVLRAQVHDTICLFDGSGNEFSARIEEINRSAVTVQVCHAEAVDRERPAQLIVGSVMPKGERQRWLVEKLVELGAAELIPLRTRRSIVHPNQRASAKLRRAVIEASKQCGRNRLMQVAELQTLESFLQAAPPEADRVLADPSGDLFQPLEATGNHTYVAVGPEGGFTQDELETASSVGWQIVSLGPRILRIETACLLLAANSIHWK
jgi:16S rRNA (uracil1498-N3)-methyltransferase